MSDEEAGNRLRALVKALSDDLWIAAATFEVYAPTGFDKLLIQKANERGSILHSCHIRSAGSDDHLRAFELRVRRQDVDGGPCCNPRQGCGHCADRNGRRLKETPWEGSPAGV
jgi:hypothetical protein